MPAVAVIGRRAIAVIVTVLADITDAPAEVRKWHEPDLQRCLLFGRYRGKTGHGADSPSRSRMTLKRARAENAQNCFLYRLLLVVAASTFGFLIDGIETEFLRADCTSEFSRNQDPERSSPCQILP